MQTPGPCEEARSDSDQAMLQQYLAQRDTPCPACGYNLRQLQGGSCPECGRGLVLQVGVAKVANTWITALVGALVPAGCGIPFHILLLFAFAHGASLLDLTSEPMGILFLLLVFYTLSCVLVSILLLVFRQPFMRLRNSAQRGIATALILSAIAAAILALALLSSL